MNQANKIQLITRESDFYFWLVDHLHQLGPKKMYPKALIEAAERALELIPNGENEEELLTDLIPGAHLCPGCRPPFNQALGLAFYLAREVDDQAPYSERTMQFLAECYRPPKVPDFESAARTAFKVAELHRTGVFKERESKRRLHLLTTKDGEAALGVQVHLRYPKDDPYFDEDIRQRADGLKRARDRVPLPAPSLVSVREPSPSLVGLRFLKPHSPK